MFIKNCITSILYSSMKLKYLLIIKLFFAISNLLVATDDLEISNFSNNITKTLKTPNGSKLSISESIGNWQDNKGNYGKSRLIFYVEEHNKVTKIRGYGELVDQENSKIWILAERESYQKAGVGKLKIIDANKKYKNLLKLKCVYAVKYLDDRSFLKAKCK